jgi:hypothetical protein
VDARESAIKLAERANKEKSPMMIGDTRFSQLHLAVPRKAKFGVCLVLCILGLGLSASAQEGRIITFDAPGADTTPGDYNGTYPSSINVWGVVTGSYQGVDTVFYGFLRGPGGKFTSFQAPGADTTAGSYNGTSPISINDLGAITGSYYDANGFTHGFLRSPDGKFTTIDVPGAGGYGIFPKAINLEGAIVGNYTDSNYSFRAFLRSPDGTFTTWVGPGACETNGSQGCYGSGASNINAFGIIVGGFEDNSGNFVHHNMVRSRDGKLRISDVPGSGTGSYQGTGCPGCSLGFNQLGAIAGIYIDANSVQHGFLSSPNGKFTTFDAPGAGTDSYEGTGCSSDCPTSLNDWGAVTGTYIDANFVYHGYLRTLKGKIATIDPPGSLSTSPSGINDSGVITGTYIDANFVYHGFVRIPD